MTIELSVDVPDKIKVNNLLPKGHGSWGWSLLFSERKRMRRNLLCRCIVIPKVSQSKCGHCFSWLRIPGRLCVFLKPLQREKNKKIKRSVKRSQASSHVPLNAKTTRGGVGFIGRGNTEGAILSAIVQVARTCCCLAMYRQWNMSNKVVNNICRSMPDA